MHKLLRIRRRPRPPRVSIAVTLLLAACLSGCDQPLRPGRLSPLEAAAQRFDVPVSTLVRLQRTASRIQPTASGAARLDLDHPDVQRLRGVLERTSASRSTQVAPVGYTVSPVMADSGLAGLAVEIRFEGDADGETRLALPSRWAGTDSLWRHLGPVEVQGAASVRHDGPAARVIAHAPGAPLVVRYRVSSAYAGEPGLDYQKAEPLILPGWFFFHGEGVFATPEGREQAPARFAWSGFPPAWKVASDLDHLAGARPGTVADVYESVAIGAPDLVLMERPVGGAPLRMATRGAWTFAPEAFARTVEAIVTAQNALWGDPGRPFFVPLAPLGDTGDRISSHGSGRSDGFSIASTTNLELASATRTLAHEYMHTWISPEIGDLPRTDEALDYWLSEGFTDFYAARALLRSGLWSVDDYVRELNTVLLRYAVSPARTATAAQVMERFWTDRDHERMPYDRGHLMAIALDHRVRQATGGRLDLDDVMQAQRAAARRNGRGEGRVPAAALFPAVVRQTAGIDVAAEIARHAVRGEPVLLPADAFTPCAQVRTAEQPDFHRGFDLAATEAAGGVVTGLDPAHPAYAAGLRDGMRILRREGGVPGDAGVEYVYRVMDGDTERVVRYLPQGKGRVIVQRVVPAPDASAAECARRMSGG